MMLLGKTQSIVVYDSSTWEVEAEDLEFKASFSYIGHSRSA